MSEPLSKGAELIFPVEDLSNLGYGVGHAPDGRVIFAAGALPGDRVRAILIKITGSYFVARVTEILSASPFREADACGAPLSCGGCVYRGLTYKKELEGLCSIGRTKTKSGRAETDKSKLNRK